MNYCILNSEAPEQVTLGCILHMAGGTYCRCCQDYQAGLTKPAYPVPTTIRRITNCGLGNGLIERNKQGAQILALYDNPTPLGELFFTKQMLERERELSNDLDF